MSNKNWLNGTKNLDSEMHAYQQFGVDIVPPPSNFFQNETPAQVTSCEFRDIFQPAVLLKRTSVADVFLQILNSFSGCNLI